MLKDFYVEISTLYTYIRYFSPNYDMIQYFWRDTAFECILQVQYFKKSIGKLFAVNVTEGGAWFLAQYFN